MSTQPAETPAPPRSTLARSTLLKMGVRIGVIIAVATVLSYLHISRSFRREALERLRWAVAERSQREEGIFVLAENDHAIIQKAFMERLQALRGQDPDPLFNSLFARRPDGTIRNKPQGFDGTRMPGVFVPPGVNDDAEFRRRLVASYEVVAQYGPAFHVRFTDTGIMLPEGVVVGYWPEGPTYFQDLEATFNIKSLEYFTLALPENNPERKPAWTGIFEDTPTRTWMVTVTSPVDIDGRFAGTVSHDVLLDELVKRTLGDHPDQAYNLLFRGDGLLIAHPELRVKSGAEAYNILTDTRKPEDVFEQGGTPQQRAHLRALMEAVKALPPGQAIVDLKEYGEYLAVERLKGPGWFFVIVLPTEAVSSAAFNVARYVLLFGLASLLVELAVMSWVLRQQISRPLLAFNQAADQVTAGDFKVQLDTARNDELGRLATAFGVMAQEVRRREEALRQANEGLEHRVEERTQELKGVHRQLVETAREVGRAEIATNVLHNVGNVLNSVHTSALLARERLSGMKLDGFERVVGLLEERQGDMAAFLTETAQGRNALPFLRLLTQHLRGQQEEIQGLLNDVSRHTEHIGAIVKLQQRYARRTEQILEPVELGELMEDALRINQAGLNRHAVTVERHLEAVPSVVTEKHKVLMILVNLISNAKYAMEDSPEAQRSVTVRLELAGSGKVRLEVSDKGVGIAPEMMARIFEYGFTTRQEGHGFGLHSSALAAQELGGSLSARSDGPGQGATFTLELPVTSQKQSELVNA